MNIKGEKYNQEEIAWVCIKVTLLIFWMSNMFIMLADLSPICFLPIGVCKLFCFSALFTSLGKLILSGAIVLFSLLYLLEKQMFFVTFVQFLISTIIISHHESNGMFHHATIFSPLFAAQSLAYWQYHRNKDFAIAHYRTQYSIQMISASYTLAGISKINASGLEWINSGNFFALQIVKNYSFIYFATGIKNTITDGYRIANYLQHHTYLIKIFLSISLFLELFCFLALISKSTRIAFGIGLLFMHTGIWLIMGIPFGVIAPVMLILFLNPLHLFYQLSIRFISIFKTST